MILELFERDSILIATIIILIILSTNRVTAQKIVNSISDSLTVSKEDSILLSDTLPTFANLGYFHTPYKGKVISHYGPRGRRFHAGTDIYLHLGDSVRAAFTGIVTKATWYYGYGQLVVLRHVGDIETYYGHLSKILVKTGDTIPVGSVVGLGGRTGRATCTHLHFEFRVDHIAYNSEALFDFGKQVVLCNAIPVKDPIRVKEKSIQKDSIPDFDSPIISNQIAKVETPNSEEIVHIIEKNDTLYSLAKYYGTTINALCELNQIDKNSILSIGKRLKIK